MKVVILCGGQGTRLREETEYKPKPMVQIGDRPILWHIMKTYEAYGFSEFILCLGYRQEYIKEFFLHYEHMSCDFSIDFATGQTTFLDSGQRPRWKVTLVDTGLDTKKGGRLRKVEPYIDGEEFMMTYGDGVADVNLEQLLNHHRRIGKLATFTGVHPISRFGTVEVNKEGNVVAWREKTPLEAHISGGFFVLNRGVFDYIERDCEFEEEPMQRLAENGQVAMYRHEGFWHCMDTYRDYLWLNELWARGNAPWRCWQER